MGYSEHIFIAGETVTAANLMAVTTTNWQASALGLASAAGELPYATGANALAMLSPTANAFLHMSGDGVTPKWSRLPGLWIPLCGQESDTSGSYSAIQTAYWVFSSSLWPTNLTVYFQIDWSATGVTGQAKVGLRDITAGSDAWSSTLSTPVTRRYDSNTVTLTNGHKYKVYAQSEQGGQSCTVHSAMLYISWS